MKKIVVLLLLMVSANVFAEWTPVGVNSDMTVYADSGTIKKKGNKVKMWSLNDLKTVKKIANDRYWSIASHQENDCEEETTRILDLYFYSGNMRQGDVVYSNRNIKDEPESIIPGSTSEALFEIACGKK